MLIRPEQRAVERIDIALAVRPEDGHITGGHDQLRLKTSGFRVFIARLRKSRGKTDRPSCSHSGQFPDDPDSLVAVHADKDCVRGCRQITHGAEGGHPLDRIWARMNAPDIAIKAHEMQLAQNLTAPVTAADHCDRARPQQTRKITAHGQSPGIYWPLSSSPKA